MSQSYSCVATRNSTVMVIITLKTILNVKVGYRFCQVIIALTTTNSGSIYEIQNLEEITNILVRSSRGPQKNGKRPYGGRSPRLTTTVLGDSQKDF